ncbi:MAG: hypothetical protein EP318_15695 [Rhodobacteraceae bacterium]|nr:MAG: hypothetical protein EP318_15695 [Paracoccaceae bacterium]
MSDLLEIQPGEHGLVRVFTLDLALDEAEALLENDAAALKSMTGATAIDPDHIDLFDMNDLGGLPLADYLAEGHGIPEDELAPHRAQLDRVKGRVIVLRSAAFEGLGQTLRVTRPLRWIATFGEPRDQVPLEKLRSETATGAVADPPVEVAPAGPRPRPGWIVGGVVALVALALLVWALR